MRHVRIALTVALIALAGNVAASFIYCFVYSQFDITETLRLFRFPYCQWLLDARFIFDATSDVTTGLRAGFLVPTFLVALVVLRPYLNPASNGLGPRARRPFVGMWRQ